MSYRYIIGIDEVGRGPLAGPVTVGAVCVSRDINPSFFEGIRDSKQLSAQKRRVWKNKLKGLARAQQTCAYAVSSVSPSVIDRIGINRAIAHAMGRSLRTILRKLNIAPDECVVLLDGGLRAPASFLRQKTIIRGDEQEPVIGLASILAKVHRDTYMERLAIKYPLFGFDAHKGYGTASHIQQIRRHGPCNIHRRSFIKRII